MHEGIKTTNHKELQAIANEQLHEALESHKQWLKKKKTKLKRFDFQNTDLSDKDLSKEVLSEAILAGSDLTGANLREADLAKASLRRANFQDADLSYANLTGATGLSADRLGGTNLDGAKLPPSLVRFEGLARVDELARKSGKIFVSILLSCLYAWLTLLATRDVQLLTNTDTSPLPLFQTQIPIVGFFWAAPIILICLFLYFQLYMRHLWEGIAGLPAVFPDGSNREDKASSWLVMNVLRAYKRKHRPPPESAPWAEPRICILLTWWLVPVTLLGLWARCLPRHDKWLTGVLVLELTVAIAFASYFQHQAKITLCGLLTSKPFRSFLRTARPYMAALFFLTISVISDGAINGPDLTEFQDKPWKESLSFTDKDLLWRKAVRYSRATVSNVLGEYPVANFFEKEVSKKPTNWFLHDREDLWRIVEPAHLLIGNLRRANMKGAFLMGADLRGADLREANMQRSNLVRANLRHAQLQATDLRRATLTHADLFRALLPFADLAGADLNFADLREANLRRAHLNPTDVSEELSGKRDPLDTHIGQNAPPGGDVTTPASVMGADMREADLMEAHLQGVNFTKTDFSHADLTKADLSWANLTEVDLTRTDLTATILNGSNLKKANLRKSNLRDSIGLTQAQVDQACTSNDTNLPYGLTKPSPCQD